MAAITTTGVERFAESSRLAWDREKRLAALEMLVAQADKAERLRILAKDALLRKAEELRRREESLEIREEELRMRHAILERRLHEHLTREAQFTRASRDHALLQMTPRTANPQATPHPRRAE